MMEHLLLTSEHAESWWPGLVGCVTEALEEEGPTEEMLFNRLKNNEIFGIIIVEGEEVLGFLTAHFRQGADSLLLEILTLGGKGAARWAQETMKMLETAAKKVGATQIVFQTQRMAERFLTKELGFEKLSTVYRKKV